MRKNFMAVSLAAALAGCAGAYDDGGFYPTSGSYYPGSSYPSGSYYPATSYPSGGYYPSANAATSYPAYPTTGYPAYPSSPASAYPTTATYPVASAYPSGNYGASAYPSRSSGSIINGTTVGGLVGAGAGALLGNQFGKGNGKLATTAGGALIGAIAGGMLGNRMQNSAN